MLFTLLAATVLGAGAPGIQASATQVEPPYFARLFPAPTGANAFEYYVQAIDYSNKYGVRMAEMGEVTDSGESLLAWEERLSARAGNVLALVERGNRLKFDFPGGALAVQALMGLKSVAKTLYQYAEVQFAHGQPNEGVDTLLALVEMSDRLLEDGPIACVVIGVLSDNVAFACFDRNYSCIAVRGAEQILQRVKLRDASDYLARWREEVQAVDQDLRDPSHTGGSLANIGSGLAALGSEAISAIHPKWSAAATASTAELAALIELPERQWMNQKTRLDRKLLLPDEAVASVLLSYGPEEIVANAVLVRTRRRLLRLHALIAKSRWDHGKLPADLSGFPEEATFDPAANLPFQYRVFERRVYDLASPGNRYHGVIRLRQGAYEMPRIDG